MIIIHEKEIIVKVDPRYENVAPHFQISLISDVCIQRITETILLTTLAISLLVIALLVIGPFTYFEQQVNADNSNGNKSCSNHHSGNGNCSPKDSTPFILPFP